MDSVKRRTLIFLDDCCEGQSSQRGWASGSFERDEHERLLCLYRSVAKCSGK